MQLWHEADLSEAASLSFLHVSIESACAMWLPALVPRWQVNRTPTHHMPASLCKVQLLRHVFELGLRYICSTVEPIWTTPDVLVLNAFCLSTEAVHVRAKSLPAA
jgi:hypothetical protein